MGSGGHFIDRGSGTKPQLNGEGELSLECPLSLSHAVNRATGYYGTSADAGGDLFWQNDIELITIGPFYAEDAEIRRTTVAELPSSHVVVAKRRLLTGVFSPTGEKIIVIYDDPAHPTRPSRVGVLPAGGGTILRVDTTDNEKLSAGLTGDQPERGAPAEQ